MSRRPRRATLIHCLLSGLWCISPVIIGPLGCSDGTGTSSSTASVPRPAPPESIDAISRALIESRAAKVSEAPDSRATWMAYGDACLMNLWPEEAVVAYRTSLENVASLDPTLVAKVRWRLARALHDSGDGDAADVEATTALDAIPGFGDGWVTLASWRLDRGELDAADEALAKADEIATTEARQVQPIRKAIVSVQLDLQQGRTDAARTTVDDLLARGIDDRTINRLAVAVGRAQGDESFVADHEGNAAESLVVSDDSIISELTPLARFERADLLRCLSIREAVLRGQIPPQRALEQIAPYVKQRPRLAMLRVIVADLMRGLGGYEEARQVLDLIYEDDPPDHEYWSMDAAIRLELAKQGQVELLDRARTSADRAIEINPTIAYGWQIRAMIHEQDKEWTAAAEAYRKAATHAERPEDADRWLGDAMRCDAESVQP
jgi:tetratricopeptide (TPR) repeat protein